MEWSSEFCRKRHPTDDLNEEQPLSKRLSLLNLNYGTLNHLNNNTRRKKIKTQIQPMKQHPPPDRERMEVDNVVYVSDLESDSESDADERVIFLPDIERKLSKIPYSLVNGDQPNNLSTSTELVLYSIPSSISVPEPKDVVRRAIIEARQRLREKNAELALNSISPVDVTKEMSGGLSNSEWSRASNHAPNPVFNGGWIGMPNTGVTSSVNGVWEGWRPLDGNMGIRPSANFEDVDAMEIE